MPYSEITVILTVPLPAGDVAVIEVPLLIVKVALVLPNFTAVELSRNLPAIVTVAPPRAGPWFGVMLVISPAKEHVTTALAEPIIVMEPVPALVATAVNRLAPAGGGIANPAPSMGANTPVKPI